MNETLIRKEIFFVIHLIFFLWGNNWIEGHPQNVLIKLIQGFAIDWRQQQFFSKNKWERAEWEMPKDIDLFAFLKGRIRFIFGEKHELKLSLRLFFFLIIPHFLAIIKSIKKIWVNNFWSSYCLFFFGNINYKKIFLNKLDSIKIY